MNTFFNTKLIGRYKSLSQMVRVMSEDWVQREMYSLSSKGGHLIRFPSNRRLSDFSSSDNGDIYELKSKNKSFGQKILAGNYYTTIQRLQEKNKPHFIFLTYDRVTWKVVSVMVIPRHFFKPRMIKKRKPLSDNAQRKGWTGCSIIMDSIPENGKIFIVKDGVIREQSVVIKEWKRALLLKNK